MTHQRSRRRQFLASIGGVGAGTLIAAPMALADEEDEYAKMGERFEQIAHRTFGHDGFDDALARIARIEAEFDLADLGALKAPLPPRMAADAAG